MTRSKLSADSPHVIVVGGGLAGLACASALAPRRFRVTLLESRQRLGGRASSFLDSATGEWLDNCQHVSLGCCTNFSRFCAQLGIERFFRREEELVFVGPQGTRHVFSAGALPAPLHLGPSFLRLSYLSWGDRIRLAFALRALARTPVERLQGRRFDQWLREHGQSDRVVELFWHVVLVSALSETIDRIDAAHARKVFVDAFFANRHGWEVWLPTVPLDRLYGEELRTWFTSQGVDLRLNAGVRAVEPAAGRGERAAGVEVELRSGEWLKADAVVLATPAHLVPELAPSLAAWWNDRDGPARLETAPISSIHLWYDRPLTTDRHVTFVGRTSQWLFNRGEIHNEPVRGLPGEGWYGQVVISASHAIADGNSQALIETVVGELAQVYPAARDARLVRSRLVTEHRAVLSVQPGVDRFRPGARSPAANLYLAGDWIQTGWPSTMEGAVRSGWLAAEAILERYGVGERLLADDLPVAGLSKWLLGL